jgi:formate/nitrite transporter FocA (FNT family)
MVWLLPSARTARILIIALLTWLVAFAKLSHVIAGSTEAAYAVLSGRAEIAAYVMNFLVPTLIGNTIGGVSLVALLNHAPVRAEVAGAE